MLTRELQTYLREIRNPCGAYDAPGGLLGSLGHRLRKDLSLSSRMRLVRSIAFDEGPLDELADRILRSLDKDQIDRLCDYLIAQSHAEEGEDEEERDRELQRKMDDAKYPEQDEEDLEALPNHPSSRPDIEINPGEDRRSRRRVSRDDPPPFRGRPEVGKGPPAADSALYTTRRQEEGFFSRYPHAASVSVNPFQHVGGSDMRDPTAAAPVTIASDAAPGSSFESRFPDAAKVKVW